MNFVSDSIAKAGLNVAASVYERIGDKPVIKNSIYESTFLAIMGPMKPVSDVLCTIYASKLIDEPNKKRIEELIQQIYAEVQNATGINIPNADELITLLLSVCKGKTCAICDTKLKQISDILNTTDVEIAEQTIKINVNNKIAEILKTITELVGDATTETSGLSIILAKYKEKVKEIKPELEQLVKKAFSPNELINCINTKISINGNIKCFHTLTYKITEIKNQIQNDNDKDLKEFYAKIKEIQDMLSAPQTQTQTLGGKTRRRRLMRSRRRRGTMRNRRRHQHSSQQSKHKNKREQH